MKDERREAIISKAREHWDNGEKDKSIDLLFEAIPLDMRSEWLLRLLLRAASLVPHSEAIEAVISLARTDVDWTQTTPHPIIYAVADIAEKGEAVLIRHVHKLAMYVAKLVANVKGFSAPFDHPSIWSIPDVLAEIGKEIKDEKSFLESMWVLMSDARIHSIR